MPSERDAPSSHRSPAGARAGRIKVEHAVPADRQKTNRQSTQAIDKIEFRHRAPHQPYADRLGAPSVSLPENVIPSADASMRLFPESYGAIARFMGLRVSGGGCSFGAGSGPI